MKLVQPTDSIENIIIQQIPELEGMGVTKDYLKRVLDTYGNRILLIFDGLDEHALGKNKDVLKIIKGRKLLNCNIIATSRTHSVREVEKYFNTVVRVAGFTRDEAFKFAHKILKDNNKVKLVLNFNPADFRADDALYKCPILLSFMCLLVRETNIDLTSKTIRIGEIYSKMVHCLYKKFVLRTEGVNYKEENFVQAIVAVGKLALKTLLSGDPLLNRSDVIKEVGEYAFDYGLLIGNEDVNRIVFGPYR